MFEASICFKDEDCNLCHVKVKILMRSWRKATPKGTLPPHHTLPASLPQLILHPVLDQTSYLSMHPWLVKIANYFYCLSCNCHNKQGLVL